MTNLWHDVPRGSTPDELNVIIEIPKGSANKYEIDKETGLIKLDRANYSSAPYPFDYGFVPQTLWEDGDALDVVVLTTFPLHPGILVAVRPVAIMNMIDAGESDAKIIAVPVEDKRWEGVQDLQDINPHTLKEIQHFFETYKLLKGKPAPIEIQGTDDAAHAKKAVLHSIDLYEKEYGQK
jgi:inorganic pyrophosphatase